MHQATATPTEQASRWTPALVRAMELVARELLAKGWTPPVAACAEAAQPGAPARSITDAPRGDTANRHSALREVRE